MSSLDPRKVAAVAESATPTSCTDVRRFVGLSNYYRKAVLRFSAIAAPLTADLLTGRAWLVPTFKTATAETPARHLVASVLPDVLNTNSM